MQTIKHALILSAGFGTRLQPITNTIPKALVEVQNLPMLDRIISQIKKTGIENVIVNTHYLADKIHNHLIERYPDIKISHEPEILETGGGALNVINAYNIDSMLIVNCDAFFNAEDPFTDFLTHWDAKKHDALLMTKNVNDKGDFALKDGFISISSKEYTFLGVYIVSKKIYKNKEVARFGFADLLFNELKNPKHKIGGYEYQGNWLDIGSHESLRIANIK